MPSHCHNQNFSGSSLGGCPQCSIAVCGEKRRKYSLENDGRKYRIGRLRYDNGFYTGEEKAADFIFFTCDPQGIHKVAVVVELKGGHCEESYKQLISTLNREQYGVLQGYVVVTRSVPKSVTQAALKAPERSALIKLLARINIRKGFSIPSTVLCNASSGETKEKLSSIYYAIG